MSFPWGIVAAVGAVGVGVVYLRSQKAATTGGGSACDLLCEAAAKQGIPLDACKQGAMYRACQAASGLLDDITGVFDGPDWPKMDAENRALNGEVELVLTPGLANRTIDPLFGRTCLHGTVLRFKNGGVPFKGFPGWDKCKPGTHDMLGDGIHLTLDPRTGAWVIMKPGLAFSGASGDPTSVGPFAHDGMFHEPNPSGKGTRMTIPDGGFPVSIDDGAHGFYDRGVAFTCPAGASPQWDLRDQRTGGGPPPCVAADGSGAWSSSGPQAGAGAATGTTTTIAGCPAGMTWDTSSGAGFWRRLNAGETQVCPSSGLPSDFHISPVHIGRNA